MSAVQTITSVATSPGVPSYVYQSGLDIHISNVQSTANLEAPLDLRAIAINARNVDLIHNPKKSLGSLVMRIRKTKATVTVHNSGKIVCVGAKSQRDSLLSARAAARIIQRTGCAVQFKEFKINNLVASADFGLQLKLDSLAYALHCSTKGQANYDPEIFPALLYKTSEVSLRIFASGKIGFAGARTQQEMEKVLDTIFPILLQHCRLNA